jgi:hypothetical protein
MLRFNDLCDPAKLYTVLVAITIILSFFRGMSMMTTIFRLIFAVFWIMILNYTCDKGYPMVSWFFVMLPFIMMFLSYMRIMPGGMGIDGQGITNYPVWGSDSVQMAAGMAG